MGTADKKALTYDELHSFSTPEDFADGLVRTLNYILKPYGTVRLQNLNPSRAGETTMLADTVLAFKPKSESEQQVFESVFEGYDGEYWFTVTSFLNKRRGNDSSWFSLHVDRVVSFLGQRTKKRNVHSKNDSVSLAPIRSYLQAITQEALGYHSELQALDLAEKEIGALGETINLYEGIEAKVFSESASIAGLVGEQVRVEALRRPSSEDLRFDVSLKGVSTSELDEIFGKLLGGRSRID